MCRNIYDPSVGICCAHVYYIYRVGTHDTIQHNARHPEKRVKTAKSVSVAHIYYGSRVCVPLPTDVFVVHTTGFSTTSFLRFIFKSIAAPATDTDAHWSLLENPNLFTLGRSLTSHKHSYIYTHTHSRAYEKVLGKKLTPLRAIIPPFSVAVMLRSSATQWGTR